MVNHVATISLCLFVVLGAKEGNPRRGAHQLSFLHPVLAPSSVYADVKAPISVLGDRGALWHLLLVCQ